MSYGSYYSGANYYENPTPYESSDIGEPVPGWGTTVSIAGPARVGVGALPRRAVPQPVVNRWPFRSPSFWQTRRRPYTPCPPGWSPAGAPMGLPWSCPGHRYRTETLPGTGCTRAICRDTPSQMRGFGQALNIQKAATDLRRLSPEQMARLTATSQAKYGIKQPSHITGETAEGEEQPGGAPGEPLPWWIWPAAAAVLLGGVGYYGTKKGWL